jgi:HPt (histidine-containing phosphotransfer) domain-containing protein
MKKDNPLNEIEKFAKSDKQTKTKLIEILIRELSQNTKHLEKSLSDENWHEVKRFAHKMKSAFLLLKMKRSIELTELLRITAGEDLVVTKQQVTELENICFDLISELKNIP